jgi:hypothetical protein
MEIGAAEERGEREAPVNQKIRLGPAELTSPGRLRLEADRSMPHIDLAGESGVWIPVSRLLARPVQFSSDSPITRGVSHVTPIAASAEAIEPPRCRFAR